jgi:hypothetical protein
VLKLYSGVDSGFTCMVAAAAASAASHRHLYCAALLLLLQAREAEAASSGSSSSGVAPPIGSIHSGKRSSFSTVKWRRLPSLKRVQSANRLVGGTLTGLYGISIWR